jgi:hypothetical protein
MTQLLSFEQPGQREAGRVHFLLLLFGLPLGVDLSLCGLIHRGRKSIFSLIYQTVAEI